MKSDYNLRTKQKESKQISFLDFLIINQSNKLDINQYRKPTF